MKKSELRQMIKEELLREEYVESMGPDFDKGFDLIVKAWKKWKSGPMTEPGDIKPAKKEILDYIEQKLK